MERIGPMTFTHAASWSPTNASAMRSPSSREPTVTKTTIQSVICDSFEDPRQIDQYTIHTDVAARSDPTGSGPQKGRRTPALPYGAPFVDQGLVVDDGVTSRGGRRRCREPRPYALPQRLTDALPDPVWHHAAPRQILAHRDGVDVLEVTAPLDVRERVGQSFRRVVG